ncbi:MAG: hypothetical protein E7588_09635 [Ruminococcaceae bacterium]|nr:hypothetical protein [Oscillospiraceae bacterium]
MLKKENKYQFRERLEKVHPLRFYDFPAVPQNTFSFKDGDVIALNADAGDVIITAARDFCDYLFDTMNISARITRSGKGSVNITIDPSYGSYKAFKVTASEKGIDITAHDERGAAQALFFLEDEMSAEFAPFIKFGTTERAPLFAPRMTHSGYMLDEFPDWHLAQIAHAGMDAVLVMTTGKNSSLRGYTDFNDLIRRAAKWGIDVYAYSYYRSLCHPDDPAADGHYESTYGALFRQCPGLKGVVLVGESVGFPTRDPNASPLPYDANHVDGIPADKPSADFWPCTDYAPWLSKIKSIINRYTPDADIVFWSYNWGYADTAARQALIRSLPRDVSLLVTFETFEPIHLGGDVYEQVYDYTLSFAGPGRYFISEAEVAHECGIRLYAMTNTGGNTWDMGGVPYQPMPQQWRNRAAAVIDCKKKYNISGIMESHQYGFMPSIISEMIKFMYDTGCTDTDGELVRIMRRHFGAGHENEIISALSLWSEAIRLLSPSGEEQCGAFRVGPSFPFSIAGKYKYPADGCSKGYFMDSAYRPHNGTHQTSFAPSGLRMPYQRARLVKMLGLLEEGRKQLEAVGQINDEYAYLINLGHYMECVVTSGINAKDWYTATHALPVANDRNEIEKLICECERILDSERENVKRALPLAECDSRLGWDPRMEYVCDPARLEWKLRLLDHVQTTELDKFRKPNRWTIDGIK